MIKKHDASSIAKWFLNHNREVMARGDAELISNLKLQKLLYYAQGVFLAANDEPLFANKILAWKHGPVVRSVYLEYSSNGSDGIAFDDDFSDDFTSEENNLLEQVYSAFGQFSAWKLREMTHEEEPWLSTKTNHEISVDLIKDYFKREYWLEG